MLHILTFTLIVKIVIQSTLALLTVLLAETLLQPIRSTTHIWAVTRRQCIISAVHQTSFHGETSSGAAKMSAVFIFRLVD